MQKSFQSIARPTANASVETDLPVSLQIAEGHVPEGECSSSAEWWRSNAGSIYTEFPVTQRSSVMLGDDDERNQALVEHLPIVKFIARRIHERLP